MTRVEVLATPKAGLDKDDLLAATVAAVGIVDRASARRVGRTDLVSVVVTVPFGDAVDPRLVAREVGRYALALPEVTVR